MTFMMRPSKVRLTLPTVSIIIAGLVLSSFPVQGSVLSASRLIPPYSSLAENTNLTTRQLGCAKETTRVSPFWNGSTGLGGVSLRAAASDCKILYNVTYGLAAADAYYTFYQPLRLPTGPGTVSVQWHFSARVWQDLNLTNFTCQNASTPNPGSCLGESAYQIIVHVYLDDLTNNTSIWSPQNTRKWSGTTGFDEMDPGQLPTCFNGCPIVSRPFQNRSVNQSFPMSGTFNSGHLYRVTVEMDAFVGALIDGYWGKATASLDMASGGFGFQIKSIRYP